MNIIFDINNLFRLVEMTLGRDAETKRWDETLRRNAGTKRWDETLGRNAGTKRWKETFIHSIGSNRNRHILKSVRSSILGDIFCISRSHFPSFYDTCAISSHRLR